MGGGGGRGMGMSRCGGGGEDEDRDYRRRIPGRDAKRVWKNRNRRRRWDLDAVVVLLECPYLGVEGAACAPVLPATFTTCIFSSAKVSHQQAAAPKVTWRPAVATGKIHPLCTGSSHLCLACPSHSVRIVAGPRS